MISSRFSTHRKGYSRSRDVGVEPHDKKSKKHRDNNSILEMTTGLSGEGVRLSKSGAVGGIGDEEKGTVFMGVRDNGQGASENAPETPDPKTTTYRNEIEHAAWV